jgi:hypothetical protein
LKEQCHSSRTCSFTSYRFADFGLRRGDGRRAQLVMIISSPRKIGVLAKAC